MKDGETQGTLPAALSASGETRLPERYQDLGRVGQGGMGDVRRVRDLHLDRVLAMKVLRWGLFEDERARARFLAETQLNARLQHPGIVPVHDRGVLKDGRPWFTMRLIEGRTLGEVVAAVRACSSPREWGTTPDGWSLRRLAAAFETVCRIVGYIHGEGVAHCDLKPENIMVGRFGEVLLVDWGIARVVSEARSGAVLGTPRYMAPEQARGEVTAASDVYSLGAILHMMLRGEQPSPPSPPELLRLIAAATATEGHARPKALALADGVRLWLEGALRRERARRELSAAREMASRPRALREQAAALREQAQSLLDSIPPHAPGEQKQEAWRLEEQADALGAQADQAEASYTRRLHAVLEHDPSLGEAHERLADHYRDRLEQAEAAADRQAVLRTLSMLKAHDQGKHAAWLEGTGAVTLVTDPPAAATLLRFVRRSRRRVLEPVRALGHTPLIRAPLAPGSYLIRLERPGYPTVDYPIQIGRCEHWTGIPPGESAPHVLRLPPSLAARECLVPAGWFVSGGDGEALDGLSRRRLWVDSFIAARDPVTHAEFLVFLDALGEEAERLVPSEAESAERGRPLYTRDSSGRFRLAETHDGVPLRPHDPVIYVDRDTASTYARWRAATTGLPWRLPHDQEWEKAARGVDGRFYPWGNSFDPSFCCMASSHSGVPCWAPVGGWPADRSVYGVRGMAGNVRDWCANPYTRDGPPDGSRVGQATAADAQPSVIRGGSWSSAASKCRSAGRFAGAGHRLKSLGFRLVRSVR